MKSDAEIRMLLKDLEAIADHKTYGGGIRFFKPYPKQLMFLVLAALLLGLSSSVRAQLIFDLQYSPGVALGFAFDFPHNDGNCPGGSYNGNPPCPQADYATYSQGYNLAGRQTMSIVFTVIAVDAVFNHVTQPDGNEASGGNYVHAFFQESGDNLSGQGVFAYYRWWGTSPISLPDGTYTQTFVLNTPLTPSNWSSVQGENGANSAVATAGFNGALANTAVIGMTFGGGYFAGHGLNLTSGNVTFVLNGILAQ